MRVLIVYPRFYVYGGGEILIVRLCNYLSKIGIKNSLLTTEIMPQIQKDLNETEIIVIPSKIKNCYLSSKFYNFISGLIKTLNEGVLSIENNFDIINIHNFPAELAIEKLNKPLVWMCNEPEIFLTQDAENFKKIFFFDRVYYKSLAKKEKKLVRDRFDASVVADEYNARRFTDIFGITPVINNYGIDYDFFSTPPKIKTKFSAEYNGYFIVLHVGMLTPFKNQLESLIALNAVRQKIPNIKLLLIGSSFEKHYRNMCDKFISENNLWPYVEFIEHVDREKLREYFYLADVMLHPIKAQGGWLSPFEMLSAGRPIVVSKDMTASSIIKENNIGIVTDDYAEALCHVCQNKNDLRSQALMGQQYVSKNLSWDKFGENMVTIFRNVIEK